MVLTRSVRCRHWGPRYANLGEALVCAGLVQVAGLAVKEPSTEAMELVRRT